MTKQVFAILLFASILFASCKKEELPEPSKGRTILVYINAENNLSYYVSQDMNEMLAASAKMKDGDRVVVYVDDLRYPRIYSITNKSTEFSYYDIVAEYSYKTDKDSSSPETLREFISYVKRHYPAESYGLFLWSHGSGWIKPNGERRESEVIDDIIVGGKMRKSFGSDTNLNIQQGITTTSTEMSISDLKGCLVDLYPLEFVYFDACYMMSVEVTYALRNIAKYIVGTAGEMPGGGAPYNLVLPRCFEKDINYGAMLEEIRDFYTYVVGGVAMSVVDCSQTDAFTDYTLYLIERYSDKIKYQSYSGVLNYFHYEQWNGQSPFPDFYDMNAVMKKTLTADEYEEWLKLFDRYVPYRVATNNYLSGYPPGVFWIDAEQYGGVSMFIPFGYYKGIFYNYYKETEWGRLSPW